FPLVRADGDSGVPPLELSSPSIPPNLSASSVDFAKLSGSHSRCLPTRVISSHTLRLVVALGISAILAYAVTISASPRFSLCLVKWGAPGSWLSLTGLQLGTKILD